MKNIRTYRAAAALTVMIGLCWIAGSMIFRYLLPEYAFAAFHWIPLFFLITSLIFTWLLGYWEQQAAAGKIPYSKVLNYYMIWRVAKMALSVLSIVLYMKFSGVLFKSFLITFMLFYIVILVYETLMISGFAKRSREIHTVTDGSVKTPKNTE